jgi:hypothetical protein
MNMMNQENKLSLIQGGKDEHEKMLVQKLQSKVINPDEINALIDKLKIRRGHLRHIK